MISSTALNVLFVLVAFHVTLVLMARVQKIHQHCIVNGIIKFNCNLRAYYTGFLEQGAVVDLSTMVASRVENVKVDELQELSTLGIL